MTDLRNQILVGDAAQQLTGLPDSSVDMVLTSPPYFRLRDYQVSGQLGMETTVDQWVTNLRDVSRQLQRVLVPTGSLWLNVADSYAAHRRQGAAVKSLLLGPERLALALLEDGWWLRNKIVWQKANPMPNPVRDRLTASWEAIYLFTRRPSYFFDLDAVRQPHRSQHRTRPPRYGAGPRRTDQAAPGREKWRGSNSSTASGLTALKRQGLAGHPLGKNPGDVWRIASSSYRGAHHATYPLELADQAIRAGCPEARCTSCRSPYKRSVIRTLGANAVRGALHPTCICDATSEPGLVLDPFFGAGTTAVAAERLQRDWLGIELNADFTKLASRRIRSARASPARPLT